ncbi:endonuclease/exonuclease/phosphatase family protein [Microlunatus sp. Gsoil 973]|uniref:endonuclease/exonuclease/phosphatase family protein n=1 Tax=Microlunatus sp. Gsoil 973 TaxID=2672569 RepID=UPI0012B46E72|nr:endonuclease/exonuclease/phosphatase family protein [Microlunatus sp. Gsoil 973]QGN33278.1 metal-dependent hydrolase [Microlunatus sp. Gsoil 973]
MFRRLFSALALTTAMLTVMTTATMTGTANAAASSTRVFDVMSFNIHHAEGTDGVLDVARIADVIRNSGADVVGLQEVDRHYSDRSEWADQPAELAALLGWHVVFGANIDQDPPVGSTDRIQYGTAILSRYAITSWDNTYLYNTPGQEQRGLLHARLDVRGASVDFYCTHLAASSQTDRLQQASQIVDLIGDQDPAILVGDMNATPDAPEIKTLSTAFDDAWIAAGQGPDSTYPSEAPAKRIDMIFETPSVRSTQTRGWRNQPVASDHLPVLTRVVVG